MVFVQGNLISVTVVTAGWVAVMLQWILHKRGQPSESVPATGLTRKSLLYMLVQALAIAAVYVGPTHVNDELGNAGTLFEAGSVTFLVVGALLLNMSALKTLGHNFALVARVRADGELVTAGPYAFVRNPIYLCYLLLLVATALSVGHPLNLLVALPLYLVGTVLRIAPEERLLSDRFGAEYTAYAARVKRLVPYVW